MPVIFFKSVYKQYSRTQTIQNIHTISDVKFVSIGEHRNRFSSLHLFSSILFYYFPIKLYTCQHQKVIFQLTAFSFIVLKYAYNTSYINTIILSLTTTKTLNPLQHTKYSERYMMKMFPCFSSRNTFKIYWSVSSKSRNIDNIQCYFT